jgi:biotin carboxylase
MPRVLLLLPTTTYRAADFLAAAERLNVEVVVAAERPNVMASRHPDRLITLDFANPEAAVARVREFHARHPIDAVIPVDDDTAVVAAAVGNALGFPHNGVESARAARNKGTLVETLGRRGLPVPAFRVHELDGDPELAARESRYPCVLKPLFLSASRGVIRADSPAEFTAAWRRIGAILAEPDLQARGRDAARQLLVEDFIPGKEFALEGLLSEGRLRVLALFDKPDPLNGPYFEETLYVTPSREPEEVQAELARATADAAAAIGLREGPVHSELRYNDRGPWLLELAARSIGGLCSRTLRFGTGLSLEELILSHALGLDLDRAERERRAAGVMMIPIPARGILREVRGLEPARLVAGIEEITITARLDNPIVPLPEGSSYLGFIFGRGEAPHEVETALREAHRRLEFVIEASG